MELNKWHQNISLKPAICKPVNPMSHFLVGGKKSNLIIIIAKIIIIIKLL